MERLQTFGAKIITYYLRHTLLLLTGALMIVLAVAYILAPAQAKLLVALGYLAAGIGLVLLERLGTAGRNALIMDLLPGLATAFGLLVLAVEGVWFWWLALAAVSSLLVTVPGSHRIDAQVIQVYAPVILLSVFTGLALADLSAVETDVLVLGVGIALVGQGVAVLFSVMSDTERRIAVMHDGATGISAREVAELSTRIHVTADGLVRAVQAINDVTSQQSSGASEQVDVIRLTNNLMDNFLRLSERITEQARTTTRTAEDAAKMSLDGQKATENAIQGMDQIRSQVSNIGMTIVTLAQLTRRIDEIITSVTEIATQSNLLALNASIEAARAGVHGRGFAVVADEVRSLSQQSTNAATQVRAILAEIQSAVRQTINATEIGMQGVDAGVSMTQQANRIMQQLTHSVSESNNAVRAVYDVIRQQADGLEEIAVSMDRIDRITQQNLTSTRMVATVSTNLTRLADDLQDVVKIGEGYDMPEPPAMLDDD